jgi:hypothetical protein
MRNLVGVVVCLAVLSLAPVCYADTGSGDSAVGVLDAQAPVFAALSVHPDLAMPGDEVTVTFSASEALDGDPSVLVNGAPATFAGGLNSTHFAFTYTVQPGDSLGLASLIIGGTDLVGNFGSSNFSSSFEIVTQTPQLELHALPVAAILLLAGVLLLARRRGHYLAALALVLGASAALALPPVVSNVAFQQRPDGNGGTEVVITYDLSADAPQCAVSVRASGDGGATFAIVPATLSGDSGQAVAPGTGRQIVWHLSADLPGARIGNAVIRVTADDGACGNCLRWSDPDTWGGTVPVAGEDVVIEEDMHVLLDADSPSLGGLVINGTLEFDRADLALTAEWIMVHGALRVGSEGYPFEHSATITLTDSDTGHSVMDMGTRGIMVMGGALELHGTPPAIPWTKLNQHASLGATALELAQAPGWAPGDEIVVAPTDFYGASATEHFTVAGINGAQLSLNAALAAPRWGRMQYATSAGMGLTQDNSLAPPLANTPLALDERAEVGNLTRNIVIQAPDDTAWQTHGFGVHVMVMDAGGSAHIDGVEFRRGGQRNILGRYPFHWHRLSYDDTDFIGDATGQYIRNSTINRSQNRGIVVHATNGVAVENNIIYDVRGHAVFTEDAVERRNTISGNLAIHVRNPLENFELKAHEIFENGGSSGYWIANPDNTVVNNTAADCEGHGFWLAFPNNPWGASIGVQMRPSRMLFGAFAGNTAHTSGFEGLMLDRIEIDNNGNVGDFQYISTIDEADPTWNSGTARRFAVTGFTTWKNRRGGVWDRVYWPDFTGLVSADNCGRYFAGSGADGVIERCLIVGTSLNNATPRPSIHFPDTLGGDETPVAFATYHSAFDMRNNVIVNFPLVPGERSGAFATEDYYLRPVDKGQMRNVGNVLVNSHPGYRSRPVFDHYTLVGALWDPHGSWGPAGNYFVYDEPFFTHGQTPAPVEPAGQTGGVSVSGPFYGIMEFVLDNNRPYYEPLMTVNATRLDNATLAPVGTWEVDEALSINWLLAPMRHFAAHRDGIYRVEFPSEPVPTDVEVRFENMLEESDTLVLGVQFSGAVTPNAVYTIGGGSGASVRVYTPAGSLQDVRDSSGLTYWQDTTNNLVWVKLQGGSWQFWDQSGQFAVPTSDELLYENTTLHINTD